MFDPEAVERKEGLTWNLWEHGGRECVLAEDYDKLLKMYKFRELQIRILGTLYGVGPYGNKQPEGFYGKGIGDLIRESGGLEITRIMSKEEAEVWKNQLQKEHDRPENGQGGF